MSQESINLKKLLDKEDPELVDEEIKEKDELEKRKRKRRKRDESGSTD